MSSKNGLTSALAHARTHTTVGSTHSRFPLPAPASRFPLPAPAPASRVFHGYLLERAEDHLQKEVRLHVRRAAEQAPHEAQVPQGDPARVHALRTPTHACVRASVQSLSGSVEIEERNEFRVLRSVEVAMFEGIAWQRWHVRSDELSGQENKKMEGAGARACMRRHARTDARAYACAPYVHLTRTSRRATSRRWRAGGRDRARRTACRRAGSP